MTGCPQCGSERLVLGATTTDTPAFRPQGLRFFCVTVSDLKPKQGKKVVACLDCGLLWSALDPDRLVSLMTKKGTRKTRKKLRLV